MIIGCYHWVKVTTASVWTLNCFQCSERDQVKKVTTVLFVSKENADNIGWPLTHLENQLMSPNSQTPTVLKLTFNYQQMCTAVSSCKQNIHIYIKMKYRVETQYIINITFLKQTWQSFQNERQTSLDVLNNLMKLDILDSLITTENRLWFGPYSGLELIFYFYNIHAQLSSFTHNISQ